MVAALHRLSARIHFAVRRARQEFKAEDLDLLTELEDPLRKLAQRIRAMKLESTSDCPHDHSQSTRCQRPLIQIPPDLAVDDPETDNLVVSWPQPHGDGSPCGRAGLAEQQSNELCLAACDPEDASRVPAEPCCGDNASATICSEEPLGRRLVDAMSAMSAVQGLRLEPLPHHAEFLEGVSGEDLARHRSDTFGALCADAALSTDSGPTAPSIPLVGSTSLSLMPPSGMAMPDLVAGPHLSLSPSSGCAGISDSASVSVKKGSVVQFSGLTTGRLNGMFGLVTGFEKTRGRWKVSYFDESVEKIVRALFKVDNLTLIESTTPYTEDDLRWLEEWYS